MSEADCRGQLSGVVRAGICQRWRLFPSDGYSRSVTGHQQDLRQHLLRPVPLRRQQSKRMDRWWDQLQPRWDRNQHQVIRSCCFLISDLFIFAWTLKIQHKHRGYAQTVEIRTRWAEMAISKSSEWAHRVLHYDWRVLRRAELCSSNQSHFNIHIHNYKKKSFVCSCTVAGGVWLRSDPAHWIGPIRLMKSYVERIHSTSERESSHQPRFPNLRYVKYETRSWHLIKCICYVQVKSIDII